MRVLLCGQGTSEILWSIHAALIALGHESVLALPDISQEVIDRPIDAILALNLFEIPRDTVEMLTAYVASFGKRPALVHICLKHPLEEIGAATPAAVAEADRWMARQNVRMWCMCPGVAEQCGRLGLTRVFHAPLGVHPWICALRDSGGMVHLYKRWMSQAEPGLVRYPYRAMTGEAGDRDERPRVAGRFVYLGQGCSPAEPAEPSVLRAAESVAEAMRAQPALHRTAAMDLCGLAGPSADPAWTLGFNRAFAAVFAVENRRRFATALRDAFGETFALWGDGWDRHGIAAHPVSPHPRTLYHEAAACLDFGSLAYDTAIFPRTLEILKRDGLLVSWRHAGSGPLFGPLEADLTFGDGEEAVQRLAALRDDPDRRERLRAAHREWAFDRLSLERILPGVLAGVLAGVPATAHSRGSEE
ncbi:glycosyltransferase [Roseomonas genomospecies 6]|uniref:Glycosyltransferase family 1 protein n=1 Tax=Roseomonas genomospecies 6 TaxID=214106 RepID=A0A9W7NI43_9PROT|nr:glycosyltransferase [Roseomonas genomospecies 6]KAA0679273.1 glycosyltransferase family 1 protein [Roseomonas genomospecies 6]